MSNKELSRAQLLAAEIFGYSFANYADHLGIGNLRYESLMPNDAAVLVQALAENWSIEDVACELDVDDEIAASLLNAARKALEVVDAENPAEAFRIAVRQAVQYAVADGLDDDEAIEKLVIQVCYRASDLAHLLEREGQPLMRYCRHLRREPNVGYYDGYFDEVD